MALYRDQGIVLRTYKLGEADRIVSFMTERHGKVRAVAKGVRKTKSQVRRPPRADQPRGPPALRGPRARHRHPGRVDRPLQGHPRGPRPPRPAPSPCSRPSTSSALEREPEPRPLPDAPRRAATLADARQPAGGGRVPLEAAGRSRASGPSSTPASAATTTDGLVAFDLDEGGLLCAEHRRGTRVSPEARRPPPATSWADGSPRRSREPASPATHEVDQLATRGRDGAPPRAPAAIECRCSARCDGGRSNRAAGAAPGEQLPPALA